MLNVDTSLVRPYMATRSEWGFPRGFGMEQTMFEIARERTFSASHQLRNYKGRCERLHGHNWRVRVCIGSPELDDSGMIIDFHELDRMMGVAIEPFDHRHLNELTEFETANPSAENIARAIGESVRGQLQGTHARLRYCDVFENDLSRARYIPED